MSELRVLVVDDDDMQLELVERALARDGFDVKGVDSIKGIAAAAAGHQPQIVLLDVNMPGSSGGDAIASVRGAAPGARVILYSSWEESRLRTIAAQLGADGYLSKSASIAVIGKRLRELAGGAG